ncbi:hypothetical protein [Oceanobacillus alkalisoli]|uniref:hypothetical protein n=1 Tax=Oceanobacillus alkalisoli TaxID=2925113 RepID=UPI001EE4C833|nr:hypothetical protein [Oceanobacillus alkalisoli]MCG5104403.1 hypothetical protein [Oceanobacillus alkalisoli]
MRAYIKLWDKEYLIHSVNWFERGNMCSVSFTDENGSHKTIHNRNFDFEPDAEDNRHAELLHSNLQETVIWKEK